MSDGFELGVFLPTVTRGYVPSHAAPTFEPTWPAVLDIARRCEAAGFDSALVMSKFRGPHGASDYWNDSLESFTLSGALLAATERMRVYATAGVPAFAPGIVAKMGATLAAIGPGRFGLNIVTGWNPQEYEQYGIWPGDDFFAERYAVAAEYVTILRELWQTGRSTFAGRYFSTIDAECTPAPGRLPIVTAGTSAAGIAFAAEHADSSFGMNGPGHRLVMVVIADTDEEAYERVARYNVATDHDAMASRHAQAARNPEAGGGTGTATRALLNSDALPAGNAWIGSPATIAECLRQARHDPEVTGVMLQFDDWNEGLDRFAAEILAPSELFRRA
ncbi:LLM class flavin-dependent oxidoreductase [Microbacteriaceae bacterium VKM Ac-2855]|nr:LLM class flavin-dependent oxidoreductase [Microbacteriaceae bacterium VKM Ac-2855]